MLPNRFLDRSSLPAKSIAAHCLHATRRCNTIQKKCNFTSARSIIVKGENRVNRGGSWNNDAQNCRVANRNNNTPTNRNNNLGFRLVLSS